VPPLELPLVVPLVPPAPPVVVVEPVVPAVPAVSAVEPVVADPPAPPVVVVVVGEVVVVDVSAGTQSGAPSTQTYSSRLQLSLSSAEVHGSAVIS
jgi:hypothetical protein